MDFIPVFPFDVSLKLFSFLDIQDVFRCEKVSKSWREFLGCPQMWKVKCKKLGIQAENDVDDKALFERVGQNWKLAQTTAESHHVFEELKTVTFKGNYLIIRKFHTLEVRSLNDLDTIIQVIDMEWLEYDFHPYANDTRLAVIEVEDTGHLRLRVYPMKETEERFNYLFTKQLAPIYHTSEDTAFFQDDKLVKYANVNNEKEIHVIDLYTGKIELAFPIGFSRPSIRYDGNYLVYYATRGEPISIFTLSNGKFWTIEREFEDYKSYAKLLSPLNQLITSYSGQIFDIYDIPSEQRFYRFDSRSIHLDLNYNIFFHQRRLIIYRENKVKILHFEAGNWKEYGRFGEEEDAPGTVLGLGFGQQMYTWVQPSWESAIFNLTDINTGENIRCGEIFEVGFIPNIYCNGSSLFVYSTGHRRADIRRFSFQ